MVRVHSAAPFSPVHFNLVEPNAQPRPLRRGAVLAPCQQEAVILLLAWQRQAVSSCSPRPSLARSGDVLELLEIRLGVHLRLGWFKRVAGSRRRQQGARSAGGGAKRCAGPAGTICSHSITLARSSWRSASLYPKLPFLRPLRSGTRATNSSASETQPFEPFQGGSFGSQMQCECNLAVCVTCTSGKKG